MRWEDYRHARILVRNARCPMNKSQTSPWSIGTHAECSHCFGTPREGAWKEHCTRAGVQMRVVVQEHHGVPRITDMNVRNLTDSKPTPISTPHKKRCRYIGDGCAPDGRSSHAVHGLGRVTGKAPGEIQRWQRQGALDDSPARRFSGKVRESRVRGAPRALADLEIWITINQAKPHRRNPF